MREVGGRGLIDQASTSSSRNERHAGGEGEGGDKRRRGRTKARRSMDSRELPSGIRSWFARSEEPWEDDGPFGRPVPGGRGCFGASYEDWRGASDPCSGPGSWLSIPSGSGSLVAP
jgi:hypothetical protein